MTRQEILAAMTEGGAAQRDGRMADAAAIYARVLRTQPAHPAVLNSAGVVALALGQVDAAVAHHRAATEADPNAPVLWVNLAKAKRAARDDAGERAALDQAIALEPGLFTALVRKAELHERRGEFGDALPSWQRALAVAPEGTSSPDLDAMLAHGRAFVDAHLTRFAGAMDDGLEAARVTVAGDRRRFDACVDATVGRRRIYVNHCAGTHFPFLPADEFFDRAHFPWLAQLEAATPVIRAELRALLDTGAPGFAPYVQQPSGTPRNKWSALDASDDWSAYFLWQFGKAVADAHARCPETARVLAGLPMIELPGRSPSAFFSLLRPRTTIPPHTGVTNVRAIVHLPLIVPAGCTFRVGGETRAWREGEAFAFDDTIEHEAINPTNDLRAVLILDTWNPHIAPHERELLTRYFEVADRVGLDAGAGDD